MNCPGFRSRLYFGLLTLWALLTGHAHAKELLIWGVCDFPPFQIIEGIHKGSGSFDGELQTLIRKMPEFEHKIVPMSFARRREEFNSGTNFCTPGIFKAPATALKLAISVPALTHLDNRVIFLKEKRSLFGDSPSIDLDALLMRPNLVGAVVPGRSYAPNIDDSIRRFRDNGKLMVRPLEAAQLFRMLLNNDIDYLILFPHEAAFVAEQFGAGERILNRPISGTPPYLFTHVACTGNAWGQAIIDKIDAILLSERAYLDYRKYSERWYPTEDKEKIRRHYPEMLKETP